MLNYKTSSRRSPETGFTLIELLVVIAIIAILAAILFPVFAQAREKARQTACLSNTKQIGLGIMQYANDFDETLPVGGFNAQCRGRWQGQLYPYVKNDQVFTCPNVSGTPWRSSLTSTQCGKVVLTDDRGGYGWNYALQADITTSSLSPRSLNDAAGYSLSQIKKPADTIIVGDTGYETPAGAPAAVASAAAGWAMMASDPRIIANSTNFGQPGLYAQFRHTATKTVTAQQGFPLPIDGRANFCFLDGHAKNLSIGQTFQTATTEDGNALVSEGATVNHSLPNIQYVLWNIY